MFGIISKLDISTLILLTDIVNDINLVTLADDGKYRSMWRHILTLKFHKTITSVLRVSAYIIGQNAILVILFVSTFNTDVILYLMSSMLHISKDYWTNPNDFTTRVGLACTAVISTPELLYNCSANTTSRSCVHNNHFHINVNLMWYKKKNPKNPNTASKHKQVVRQSKNKDCVKTKICTTSKE